jgi:hypothetical protein
LRKLIIWAGILTASTASAPSQVAPQSRYENDPRLARLSEFFDSIGSPLTPLAADFLAASDRYDLDWRLLPSISVIESSGGKRYVKNNVFGWDSARRGFNSIREGIYWVASRLADSRLYKGKDLDALLATYNPYPRYPRRVKAVMRRVGPRDLLRARAIEEARVSPAFALPEPDRPEPRP